MSKRSLPWLQFYPADWESDSIAGCTLAAQGLWLRMLCVMHTSRSYGCLEIEGKAIPDEMMFRRCGCANVEEYRGLLAELFTAGVPSRRPEDEVIYSRRMVRDQQDRDATAQRVRRHRERAACNASVTPMSQVEVRSQKSETEIREEKPRVAKPAPPADPRFQPFADFAFKTFEGKHGVKPCWLRKDFEHLRLLLKSNSSLKAEELERRWRNYLDSTEPFTSKQGNSLAYFASNCDKFAEGPILATPQKVNRNGKPTLGDNARITIAAIQAAEQKFPA